MVTITSRNGVTLSGNAGANDRELGIFGKALFAGRGDFAERAGGRIRRTDRRQRIADKHSFLNSK